MSIMLPLLLALSTLAFAQTKSIKAIYGEDNRQDLYAYNNPKIVALAKSTVALVTVDNFQEINELLNMTYVPFGSSVGLCPEERFKDQPGTASCSGFLISPTKIVTAGHCITTDEDCSRIRFVFDYSMKDASTANMTFTKDQVYSCSRILGREKVWGGIDYAIVELTRPAAGRTPLKLSDNKALKVADPLFVIGHPSGLPTKITDKAKVLSLQTADNYFVTNTDTYGGNSGSAVFNEKTLEVEGILVRGDTDFHSTGSCRVSTTYNEDAGTEQATLISKIKENLPRSESSKPSSPYRYVWISFSGCVEMYNETYHRIVDASFCPDAPPLQYAWNEDYSVCRELRGSSIMQEVAASYCPPLPQIHYVWISSSKRCAEYKGEQFLRYTERRFCKK